MPPRNEPETPPQEPQEHPGTGEEMTGVEHPADGTWSPTISSPPPGMVAVRLTIRPDTDHHVHPSELPQLRSQRLIVEDPAPPGATAKAAKAAGKDNP